MAYVAVRLLPHSKSADVERRPGRAAADKDNDTGASARQGRGRDADTPVEIPARGWWDIAKRVFGGIGDNRILAVAAGVTFYGLLAIFPAVAAFVSLYGLIADPKTIGDQLAALNGFVPQGALDIVGDQVRRITSKPGGALGLAFFIGLGTSLWSANAGMKAIFDALNVAYDEREKRSFIALNARALVFTFGAILFLMVAVTTVVVLPIALNMIGLGGLGPLLVQIGRWPAMLVVILLALAVLYRFGPSRDNARWSWVTPGSLVAGLGWIVFSLAFSWYIGSFGNYNETYGSLGAAIGFMTWMWLSATIILVGAEVNAETERQTARDTTQGSPAPLGQRGAKVADTVAAPA